MFSEIALADVVINEIFPNPIGTITDESLNEWIEIYNNRSNSIDVSGWMIGDNKDNDTLEGGMYGGSGTIIPAYGYAIITDDMTRVYNNFNVSASAIKLYVDDSAIGNKLGNSGDAIYLYNQTNDLIDSVTYTQVDEGKSFSLINGSWHELNPSPGYSNNETYTTGCDWKIEILLNDTEFDSEDFSWKLRATKLEGEATLLTSRAIIKDIYGDVVKEYRPFTNYSALSQKTSSTYTPNLDPGFYFIYGNLTVECDDFESENNFDDAYFLIKSPPEETQSSIEIENIYDLGSDNKAEFGDTVRIKLVVYKGNTTKDSIKAWIESKKGDKASKQSKTNVYDNYIQYTLTLPIQLYPNCDEDLGDGDYYIKVSGLDTSDSEEIKIDGISDDNCEEITTTKSTESKTSKKKFEYEVIDYLYFVKVGEEFITRVKVMNNDKEDYRIKAWSYVYRGSKSYSGDREQNKEEIVLPVDETRVIELRNRVLEAESGQYNLKVKINKNNQKTNYEITKQVTIEAFKEEKKSDLEEEGKKKDFIEKLEYEQGFRPEIIYESSTYKVKKLIPYFIITILSFLSIALIWRR